MFDGYPGSTPDLVPAESEIDPIKRALVMFLGTTLVIGATGCASSFVGDNQKTPRTATAKPKASTSSSPNTSERWEPLPEESPTVLEKSSSENVVGLGYLEEQCNWPGMFDGVMQIVDVSVTDAEQWQTAALSQSVQAGLRPLIIVEPTGLDLENLEPDSGKIDAYFEALLPGTIQGGVNIKDLGPIALCPEFNAGFSGNPAYYARDLNLFIGSVKRVAENAPISNMIDLSEADLLMPYLERVDAESLTSVGIQAFANGEIIHFDDQGRADISGYLSASKIKGILDALKGPDGQRKPMWINTGIIREDANLGITYTLEQRMAIAMAVAEVVKELKSDGVDILTFSLFMENKLNGSHGAEGDNSERRDFSFHVGDERILLSFAKQIKRLGVPLSGFAFKHDYE